MEATKCEVRVQRLQRLTVRLYSSFRRNPSPQLWKLVPLPVQIPARCSIHISLSLLQNRLFAIPGSFHWRESLLCSIHMVQVSAQATMLRAHKLLFTTQSMTQNPRPPSVIIPPTTCLTIHLPTQAQFTAVVHPKLFSLRHHLELSAQTAVSD